MEWSIRPSQPGTPPKAPPEALAAICPHDMGLWEQEGMTTGEPFTNVLWGASRRDMGAPGRGRGQSPAEGPLYGFSVNSDSGRKGATPHTHMEHGNSGHQTAGGTRRALALPIDVLQTGLGDHGVLQHLLQQGWHQGWKPVPVP